MRKDSKLQKKKFQTKRHQMQENCYLPVFLPKWIAFIRISSHETS